MDKRGKALCAALLAGSALAAPQLAAARPASSIESRLDRLEAEMQGLRGELSAARAENEALKTRAEQAEMRAQAAETQIAGADRRLAVIEARPAPATAPAPDDGFKAGATTIRLGGYIKLLASSTRYGDGEVATNSLGRDFYLPQTIPTENSPASRVTDFTAKQSRFWLCCKNREA